MEGANNDNSATQAWLQSGGNAMLSDTKKKSREYMDKVKKWIKEGPMALKTLSFVVTAFSAATSIVHILGNLLNPFSIIISVYAFIFSVVGMLLEVTPFICTRSLQRKIEFWMRALERVWGRGLFYLLLAGMQFSLGGLSISGILGYASGAALAFTSIFSFVVSWAAGNKIKKMHKKMIEEQSESLDEKSIRDAFNQYDRDRTGRLEMGDFVLVTESLGSDFTKDELRAVFDLLDLDRTGYIEFEEFHGWFSGSNDVNYTWV